MKVGSSSNLQYRTEGIKIPWTPKYQRTVIGSSRGSLSHSECSSPSLVSPVSVGQHQKDNSWLEPMSSHSTPQGSRAATLDSHSITDTVNEKDEGITTPPSKQTTPTTNPCNSIRNSVDTSKRTPEPRTVTIKKSQEELGIQICGGNLHGIFVSDVEDDSPAKGPDGLVLGDMILEYGSVDTRNKTAEEAYLEMLKPDENVRIKAQYRIEEFNKNSTSYPEMDSVSVL
ncbi:disks large homolog 5 isoform X1 [Podarcis lilfordi]|uniref:Disks large homolog 5 isoform X1 n=1 Tax=Podarcis lilfordi TaxID=74358 RepID=A0AA35P3M2_9SAUR|nr:disks large homolog 5 isoform X1 [Podarcis lilfordi]